MKPKQELTRVYVECTESDRKVKATVLTKTERELQVSMPTGYILTLRKVHRRSNYLIGCGHIEFHSNGKLIK